MLENTKSSQKFCNLAAVDAFADVVKVTNYTGLWDAKRAWYSPSATWLGAQPQNPWFYAYLTLPDGWGSCEISWNIWLLYFTFLQQMIGW